MSNISAGDQPSPQQKIYAVIHAFELLNDYERDVVQEEICRVQESRRQQTIREAIAAAQLFEQLRVAKTRGGGQ